MDGNFSYLCTGLLVLPSLPNTLLSMSPSFVC
jgi:hypothetical protein